MSKAYKATLYFYDLCGDYDIKEYEEMIKEYVLNRISTNGTCLLVKEKEKEITDEEYEDWDNHPMNLIDNINKKDKWEEWLNE